MGRKLTWAATATGLVSCWVSPASPAATLHVPTDYPTIQSCVSAAASGVDECVVAPGTFHETINFLGKAITVRSSDGADVTTIDATGLGSVVTCACGEGPDTILNGFTITGGIGTYLTGENVGFNGAGMFNMSSSPTIDNCVFKGNAATRGGGMYNANSSPRVSRCVFMQNSATFYNGGGMYNINSSPVVADCGFTSNTARFGGGMFNARSSPAVERCAFDGNTALNSAGAMYNKNSNPTVNSCTFRANRGVFGGGMLNDSSNPIVVRSEFIANTVLEDLWFCVPNGCDFGGGMCNLNSSPMVINCAFVGNAANLGAGMYNDGYSSPTTSNCTFGSNSAVKGGGMYNEYSSSPTVTNCIFWRNSPNEIVSSSAGTSIRFSDLHGAFPVGAVNGGGNIDLDPMFMRSPSPGADGMWGGLDDDYGDLRLRAGSPCVGAGDPALVAQPGETDLDGHARVLCGRVDMGAYEFGIGDYDCNRAVNLTDFSAWQSCMTAPGNGPFDTECAAFDFDGDGDVDLRDFGQFERILAP